MATMIEYEEGLPVRVGFPPIGRIKNTLGEVLSRQGIRQVRIVESEKAIHVSYFLNGKAPDPFPLEERVFVPSNREVQNFDEMPEMSASEVADTLVAKLREGAYPFVLGNFANVDVVGHMEDEAAVVFCGSKKSLASGLPMAKVLFSGHPGFGMIVLPIMCYNQIQVIVGAMLAQAYRRRIEAASAAAPHTTE
jgi:hypothetical protein